MEPQDRERALSLMTTPLDWPRWPRLPLKRHGQNGQLEVGVICAVDEDAKAHTERRVTPRVWLGTLFDRIEFDTTPNKLYTDMDAILDDGWLID